MLCRGRQRKKRRKRRQNFKSVCRRNGQDGHRAILKPFSGFFPDHRIFLLVACVKAANSSVEEMKAKLVEQELAISKAHWSPLEPCLNLQVSQCLSFTRLRRGTLSWSLQLRMPRKDMAPAMAPASFVADSARSSLHLLCDLAAGAIQEANATTQLQTALQEPFAHVKCEE